MRNRKNNLIYKLIIRHIKTKDNKTTIMNIQLRLVVGYKFSIAFVLL